MDVLSFYPSDRICISHWKKKPELFFGLLSEKPKWKRGIPLPDWSLISIRIMAKAAMTALLILILSLVSNTVTQQHWHCLDWFAKILILSLFLLFLLSVINVKEEFLFQQFSWPKDTPSDALRMPTEQSENPIDPEGFSTYRMILE